MVLALVLLWTPWASAEQPDWETTVEAGTDFPIAVGARATGLISGTVRVSLGAGVFPGSYLDAINAAVVPFTADAGYDADDAQVVKNALKNSAVIRLHGGYQLTENFYTEVGYGWVGLGGSVTGRDVIVLVTDYPGEVPPGGGANQPREYAIDSTLHMVNVEFGWEWTDLEPWIFRTALGVAWTVAADTTVAAEFEPKAPAFNDGLETYAEDYLDDLYTTTIISPTLTFGAGYRF